MAFAVFLTSFVADCSMDCEKTATFVAEIIINA